MNLLKKYYRITFILLGLGINLLVTNPLKSKYDLIFYLEFDLMHEKEGNIKKIDPHKYCALLKEISNNKYDNCEVNLNYWRREYAKDRIKINNGIKPENKLFKKKQILKEKIDISEWFSWGLIFIFALLSFIRNRTL